MKKLLSLLLALCLTLSLTACGGNDAAEDTTAEDTAVEDTTAEDTTPVEPVLVRAAAMKGPTAMGLVQLIDQFGVVEAPQTEPLVEDVSANGGSYTFMLAGAADEITPLLIKGDLDMACLPANAAATLYQKTEGALQVLAINTLGVLYIVENGESISSIQDLKGKTVVASGKDTTPEYGLRYVLQQNGIDPDSDLTIEWKSEHSECVAALAAGAADIAMLPQPFVTVAQGKIEGLRIALDLTAEWDALDNGSSMITGVVVARKDFVEQNPAAVEAFLQDYAASVEWVNANTADAAQLIGGLGIVDAAVAEKALPYCNIVCIPGAEMKEKLSGYLQVLFESQPASVGGAMPTDDFYYGA